jgi:hypothetical protein
MMAFMPFNVFDGGGGGLGDTEESINVGAVAEVSVYVASYTTPAGSPNVDIILDDDASLDNLGNPINDDAFIKAVALFPGNISDEKFKNFKFTLGFSNDPQDANPNSVSIVGNVWTFFGPDKIKFGIDCSTKGSSGMPGQSANATADCQGTVSTGSCGGTNANFSNSKHGSKIVDKSFKDVIWISPDGETITLKVPVYNFGSASVVANALPG